MRETQGVYIIAENGENGNPTPLTLELLGLGKKLASGIENRLSALLLGHGVEAAARELASRGADEVFFLDDPRLDPYNPEIYLNVLEEFLRAWHPRVILAGHTSEGQDLAPRLAFALGAGLATDCVGVEADPSGDILFTRPVFGGNALATQRITTATALATVRARVGDIPETVPQPGTLSTLAAEIPSETRLEHKGRERIEAAECPLEEAKVVVSGGRGMGGEEGFERLKELALLLGGAVGASRPAVDSGWAPTTCQVGITGKVVAPDIYVAVAISGSTQHLSGMGESGKIIAINKDPEAYIFKVSDYGVVGDWKEVLPSFTAALNGLVQGRGGQA